MRKIVFSLLVLLISSSFAVAGNATLKNASGDRMKLWCNNGGCYTKVKDDGKWGKKVRIGSGGRSNFLKHKAKYKKSGWK